MLKLRQLITNTKCNNTLHVMMFSTIIIRYSKMESTVKINSHKEWDKHE